MVVLKLNSLGTAHRPFPTVLNGGLCVFKLRDKLEVEGVFASASERNSKPRGNGAAALRQAVE